MSSRRVSRAEVRRALRADVAGTPPDNALAERLGAAARAAEPGDGRPRTRRRAALVAAGMLAATGAGVGTAYATGLVTPPWSGPSAPADPAPGKDGGRSSPPESASPTSIGTGGAVADQPTTGGAADGRTGETADPGRGATPPYSQGTTGPNAPAGADRGVPQGKGNGRGEQKGRGQDTLKGPRTDNTRAPDQSGKSGRGDQLGQGKDSGQGAATGKPAEPPTQADKPTRPRL